MNELKKVGIIFSTYNNFNDAKKCIKSCLEQSYKNIEVVVTDDGSSDDTYQKLEELYKNDTRFHIIKLEHGERGIARKEAYNYAKKLKIDYLYIIDSDMILNNNLIELSIEYFNKNSTCGALIIPEIPFSNATNFYSKVKVFERKIINNQGENYGKNSIEAARFWKIDEYDKTGGINPKQISFEETQPSIRYYEMGGIIKRLVETGVYHDEKHVTLKNLLKKKKYYFSLINKTIESENKGANKAFSRWYFFRPVLYRIDNIKEYFKHPLLTIGMIWMYICLTLIAVLEIIKSKFKKS